MPKRLSAEWLQARSELVAILVRNGVLETRNDIAGFWDGENWVSIYDMMEDEQNQLEGKVND